MLRLSYGEPTRAGQERWAPSTGNGASEAETSTLLRYNLVLAVLIRLVVKVRAVKLMPLVLSAMVPRGSYRSRGAGG